MWCCQCCSSLILLTTSIHFSHTAVSIFALLAGPRFHIAFNCTAQCISAVPKQPNSLCPRPFDITTTTLLSAAVARKLLLCYLFPHCCCCRPSLSLPRCLHLIMLHCN